MNKNKIIILVLGMLVIIIMSILIYTHKDNWFITKTEITYPDGCIEEYKGTVLTTNECTKGRFIVEEAKKNKNLNIPNMPININNTKWNLTI